MLYEWYYLCLFAAPTHCLFGQVNCGELLRMNPLHRMHVCLFVCSEIRAEIRADLQGTNTF
jgi:hypothetical protein